MGSERAETPHALPPSLCWLVTPCTHPLAFGVPLFSFATTDGCIVETAISPLPRLGETSVDPGRALGCAASHPSLVLLLEQALGGAPPAVIHSLHAHLVHKRLLSPFGQGSALPLLDPVAGLLATADGEIAAVATVMHQGLTGLITVERLARGADLRVRWVSPRDFLADRGGFARACEGLTHEDFVAGLDGIAPQMAVDGVALLLQDSRRLVPNLAAGAFLARLLADLPEDHHPAVVKGRELLAMIEVAESQLSPVELSGYADALAVLRQLLVLVTRARRPGKEAVYEQLVARPSWHNLYESILDAMVRIHQIMDGGDPPDRDAVRQSVEQVALTCRDAYSQKMVSFRGRVLSGVGELVTRFPQTRSGEAALERRFRQIAQLLGVSGWEMARPYDAGVLAAAMGGWRCDPPCVTGAQRTAATPNDRGQP